MTSRPAQHGSPRAVRASVTVLAAALVMLVLGNGDSSAAGWPTPLSVGSAATSDAQGLPTAPGDVTASCTATLGSPEIDVAWAPAPVASDYLVWESYNGGTFAVVATVTSPAWSTNPGVAVGTYQFEVQTQVGQNWLSADSSPASNTVEDVFPFCL